MKSTLRFIDHVPTPIGRFTLVVDEEGRLQAAGFAERHPRMERFIAESAPRPAKNPGGVSEAIARYFAGELDALDPLAVAEAGTPFQRAVWRILREIPAGETYSYADVARRIGRPTAVRAVGLANGANPVALVVPCHRVIGSNGTLTGYGGGLDRKRWLLAHENTPAEHLA